MKFRREYIVLLVFVLIIICLFVFRFRIDLSSDKRNSIAQQTKELMRKVDEPITFKIYLDGNLNSGFLRLKRATTELLEELSVYSKVNFNISYENPSDAESNEKRQAKYDELQSRGLNSIMVYERDKEGRRIQKAIFPWVEITYKNRTVAVNLLKNIQGNSGEENLNISIENLEFEVTDAIRRLNRGAVRKIAFLEGHNELKEEYTESVSKTLSRYFQIDRGVLQTDASILDDYKLIVIAKPLDAFTESDKFIIDQYIMHGGRVLWLIDPVQISRENLSSTGVSPAMARDLNLDDMFFKYGVRLRAALLQDLQSVNVLVNIAPAGEKPQFEPSPWFFSPLLLTSYSHPISRNVLEVKADFPSIVEPVPESSNRDFNLLLASSTNSHLLATPTVIDMNDLPQADDKEYFNHSYLPVAVVVEGVFPSLFANRMPPKELRNLSPIRKESLPTRQIFIADGDIIRNERNEQGALPLGLDRFTNQEFGNSEFIRNAVLYLAGEEEWIDLRLRTVKLSLLNKKKAVEDRRFYQFVNLLFPLIFLVLFAFVFRLIRKRKYGI